MRRWNQTAVWAGTGANWTGPGADEASGRTWWSTGPHVPPVSSSTPVNHFQTSWWTGRSCCRWASVPAGEYFCNKPAGSSVGQVQSGSLVLVFLDRKWPLHSSLFFSPPTQRSAEFETESWNFFCGAGFGSLSVHFWHHVSDFWGFFVATCTENHVRRRKSSVALVECESPSFYPFYVCCTVFTFQTKRWRGRRLTLLPSVLTDNLPSLHPSFLILFGPELLTDLRLLEMIDQLIDQLIIPLT